MPNTPRGSLDDINDLGTPGTAEDPTVGSYVSFDGFIGESDVYSSQNEGNTEAVIQTPEPISEPSSPRKKPCKHYDLQPEIYCPPSPESFLLELNMRSDDAEDLFLGCSPEVNVDAEESDESQYAVTLRNKAEEMKRLRSPSLDFRGTELSLPHRQRDMSTPEPSAGKTPPKRTDPVLDLEAFPILQGLASFTWGHPSPADFQPHLLSPVSEWKEFFCFDDLNLSPTQC